MDSQTIRTTLGLLQEDPENETGWASLREASLVAEGDLSLGDLLNLFAAAREQYRARGEWDAVARLLEIGADVAEPDELPAQLAELAGKAQQRGGVEILQLLGRPLGAAELTADHLPEQGRRLAG